jgi:hypothetical protein
MGHYAETPRSGPWSMCGGLGARSRKFNFGMGRKLDETKQAKKLGTERKKALLG